jgi:TRAP-type C4-dicarboxylate transport system substrate-binding protein
LGLGTVDMIYTGVAFAGSIHRPIAITDAPYVLRDFDHWKAYRESALFRDIAKGYEDKTKHKVMSLTYYGQRMITANKEIKKPEDMKGMKLRVPPAPLFSDVYQVGWSQCHTDRFRRSLSRSAAGNGRRTAKSAANHHG